MHFAKAVALALATLQQALRVEAAPLEERSNNVCSSGIYGELVPFLAQYTVATAYCSSAYPVSCTSANRQKRQATSRLPTTTSSMTITPSTVTTTTISITTTIRASTTSSMSSLTTSKTSNTKRIPSTRSSVDQKASAWSRFQNEPAQVAKTMCSCIETPQPCKRIPTRSSAVSTVTPSTGSLKRVPTTSTTKSRTPSSSSSSMASITSSTTTTTLVAPTTSSTTSTASPAASCTSFSIQADGGPASGRFGQKSQNLMMFRPAGGTFMFNDGIIYDSNSDNFLQTQQGPGVIVITSSLDYGDYRALQCTVTVPSSTARTGAISCTGYGGTRFFYTCPDEYGNDVLYITDQPETIDRTCSSVTLTASC